MAQGSAAGAPGQLWGVRGWGVHENPQAPHFNDFGILDVSLSPKTNIFYLWRPQDA